MKSLQGFFQDRFLNKKTVPEVVQNTPPVSTPAVPRRGLWNLVTAMKPSKVAVTRFDLPLDINPDDIKPILNPKGKALNLKIKSSKGKREVGVYKSDGEGLDLNEALLAALEAYTVDLDENAPLPEHIAALITKDLYLMEDDSALLQAIKSNRDNFARAMIARATEVKTAAKDGANYTAIDQEIEQLQTALSAMDDPQERSNFLSNLEALEKKEAYLDEVQLLSGRGITNKTATKNSEIHEQLTILGTGSFGDFIASSKSHLNFVSGGKTYSFAKNGKPFLTIEVSSSDLNKADVKFSTKAQTTREYNKLSKDSIKKELAEIYTARTQHILLNAGPEGVEGAIKGYDAQKAKFGITDDLDLSTVFLKAVSDNNADAVKILYDASIKTDGSTSLKKETLLESLRMATEAGNVGLANILLGNEDTLEGNRVNPTEDFTQENLLKILDEAVKQTEGKDRTEIIGYLADKDPTLKDSAQFKAAFVQAAKDGRLASAAALYKASTTNGTATSSIKGDRFLEAINGALAIANDGNKAAIANLVSHITVNEAATAFNDKTTFTAAQLSEVLNAAAKAGQTEIVEALYVLSLTANVSSITKAQFSEALKAAAQSGKKGVVDSLLGKIAIVGDEADINSADKISLTEANLAEYLNASFSEAAKAGHKTTLDALYARSVKTAADVVDADRASTITQDVTLKALKDAAQNGHTAIVTEILAKAKTDGAENGRATIDAAELNKAVGVSFILAAVNDKADVVTNLSAKQDSLTLDQASFSGANGLDALDETQQSKALLDAASNGVDRVVTTLLAKYTAATSPNLEIDKALLAASKKDISVNNTAIITALANHATTSLTEKDGDGNTALYNCVSKQALAVDIGDEDALPDHIEALIAKGADLLTGCKDEDTPLIQAMDSKKPNLAKAMIASVLDKTPNINDNKDKRTELIAAQSALASTALTEQYVKSYKDQHADAKVERAREEQAQNISDAKAREAARWKLNPAAKAPQDLLDIKASQIEALKQVKECFKELLITDPNKLTAGTFELDHTAAGVANLGVETYIFSSLAVPVKTPDLTLSINKRTIGHDVEKEVAQFLVKGGKTETLDESNINLVLPKLQEIYIAKKQQDLLAAVAKGDVAENVQAVLDDYNAKKETFWIKKGATLDLTEALKQAAEKGFTKVSATLFANSKDKQAIAASLATNNAAQQLANIPTLIDQAKILREGDLFKDTFIAASKAGDLENVKKLYDASIRDDDNSSIDDATLKASLLGATAGGHGDVANLLLGNVDTIAVKRIAPTTDFTTDELTAVLTEAAKQESGKDKTAIIGYLVTKDAGVINKEGFKTAFVDAAKAGSLETVNALYTSSTANGTAPSSIDGANFLEAIKGAIDVANNGNKAAIAALVGHITVNEANDTVNNKSTLTSAQLSEVLTAAATAGQLDIVNALYDVSITTNVSSITKVQFSEALKAASKAGKKEVVDSLIAKIAVNDTGVNTDNKISFTDAELTTALNDSFAEAAKAGHKTTLDALYARSVKTAADVVDADRASTITQDVTLKALKDAAQNGHTAIVTEILAKADITNDAPVLGQTRIDAAELNEAIGVSFILAAVHEKAGVVDELVKKKDSLTLDQASFSGANGLDALDATQQSKALLAAASNGVDRVVTTLLAKYTATTSPNLEIDKALLAASKKDISANNNTIITGLANRSNSIDQRDTDKNTALYNRITKKVALADLTNDTDPLPDDIAILIEKGANLLAIHDGGDTPLIQAMTSRPNLAKAMIYKANEVTVKPELEPALAALLSSAGTQFAQTYKDSQATTTQEAKRKRKADEIKALSESKAKRSVVDGLATAFDLIQSDRNLLRTDQQIKLAEEDAELIKSSKDAATTLRGCFKTLLGSEGKETSLGADIIKHEAKTVTSDEKFSVKKNVAGGIDPIVKIKIKGDGTATFTKPLSGKTITGKQKGLTSSLNEGNLDEVLVSLRPIYQAKSQKDLLDKAGEIGTTAAQIEDILKKYHAEKLQFGIPKDKTLDLAPALAAATRKGNAAVINALHAASVSRSNADPLSSSVILSNILTASKEDSTALIALLDKVSIGASPGKIAITAEDLTPSIIEAANSKKAANITLLIAKHPTARSHPTFTKAFVDTAKAGDAPTIKALYEASIDGTSTITAEKLGEALLEASKAGHEDAVNLLLGNANTTRVTITPDPALTANHLKKAFVETAKITTSPTINSAAIIPLLVAKDINLKTQPEFSDAFIAAAKAGDDKMVVALFAASLDSANLATPSTLSAVNLKDAIKAASESGKSNVVESLLKNISPTVENGKIVIGDADLETLLNEAFSQAANNGNKAAVEVLFARSIISTAVPVTGAEAVVSTITSDKALASLKKAAEKGHNEVVGFLIENAKSGEQKGAVDVGVAALKEAIGVSFVRAASNGVEGAKAFPALLATKALVSLTKDSLELPENNLDTVEKQTAVLSAAAANGVVDQIIPPLLAQYPNLNVDASRDSNNNTLLYNYIAGLTGDIKDRDIDNLPPVISALLQNKADLLAKCGTGLNEETPLIKAMRDKPNLASAMIAKSLVVNRARTDLKDASDALKIPVDTKAFVAAYDAAKVETQAAKDAKTAEKLKTEREALVKDAGDAKKGVANYLVNTAEQNALNEFDKQAAQEIKEIFELITTQGGHVVKDPKDHNSADAAYTFSVGITARGGQVYKAKRGDKTKNIKFTIPGGSSQAYYSLDDEKTSTPLTPDSKARLIKTLKPIYKNDAQNDLLSMATNYEKHSSLVQVTFESYEKNKSKLGIEANDNLDLNLAFLGASEKGYLEIMGYLYDKSVNENLRGENVSSIDHESVTKALKTAASSGRADIVDALLGNTDIGPKTIVIADDGTRQKNSGKIVVKPEQTTQNELLTFIKEAASAGSDKDRAKIITALYDKLDLFDKDSPPLTKEKIWAALSESLTEAVKNGHSEVVELLLSKQGKTLSSGTITVKYSPETLSAALITASKNGNDAIAKSVLDKLKVKDGVAVIPAAQVEIVQEKYNELLNESFVRAAANDRKELLNTLAPKIKADEDLISDAVLGEIETNTKNKGIILDRILLAASDKGFTKIVEAVANKSEDGKVDVRALDKEGRPVKETPLYHCVSKSTADLANATQGLPPEIEALIAKGADIFAVCKIAEGLALADSNTPINQAIQSGKANLAAKMVARAKEVRMTKLTGDEKLPIDEELAFSNAANAVSKTATEQDKLAFKTDHEARVRMNDQEILNSTVKDEKAKRSTFEAYNPVRTETAAETGLKEVKTESYKAIIKRIDDCFAAIVQRNSDGLVSGKFPKTKTGAISSGQAKFEIAAHKATNLYSKSYVVTDSSGEIPVTKTIVLNDKAGVLVGAGITVSTVKGKDKKNKTLDEKSVGEFIRGLKDVYVAKKQDELLAAAANNKYDLTAVLNDYKANKKLFEIAPDSGLDLKEAYLVAKANGKADIITLLEAKPYGLTEAKVFVKEPEGLGAAKISEYLPVAAKNKQFNLVRTMANTDSSLDLNVDIKDSSGNTVIYNLLSISDAASRQTVNNLVKTLSLNSKDINITCDGDNTALHAALKSKNYDIAPTLINMMVKEIHLDQRNSEGQTAFDLIAEISAEENMQVTVNKKSGTVSTKDFLLRAAADAIHDNALGLGKDLLSAAKNKAPEILTFLAGKYKPEHSKVNIRDNDQNTPLYYIASQTSSDPEKSKAIGLATHALLEKGAQPFFKGKDGNTPLHMALKLGNYDVAKLMMSKVNSLNHGQNFTDIKNDLGESVNDLVNRVKDPAMKASLTEFISDAKVLRPAEVKEMVGELPVVQSESLLKESLIKVVAQNAAVNAFLVGGKGGKGPTQNPPPATSGVPLVTPANPSPPKKGSVSQTENIKTLLKADISSSQLKAAIEALSKDSSQALLQGDAGKAVSAKDAAKSRVSTLAGESLELAARGMVKKAVIAARNDAAEKALETNKAFDPAAKADRFERKKFNGIDFTNSKNNSFANCEFSGNCNFGNIGGNGNKFVNCTFGKDCVPQLPIDLKQFDAKNFSQCKFAPEFLAKLPPEFSVKLKIPTVAVDGLHVNPSAAQSRQEDLTPAQKALPSNAPKQPLETFKLAVVELDKVR